MLQIAIVEDDKVYTKQLEEYLQRYSEERGIPIQLTKYSDGIDLVEGYSPTFDLILMDVEMPFMDGMTAAEEIRKSDKDVVIIFITNMAQYAIRGYAVDALDYILKPLEYFAFSQRLDRAISRMENRKANFITITVKGGTQKINLSRLRYIESQNHDLLFHTQDAIIQAKGTLREFEEALLPLHFSRGNHGYLINLEHVDAVRDGCAIVGGTSLAISRGRREPFLRALTDYLGGTIK